MTSAHDLLNRLAARGVTVERTGVNLRLHPAETLTDEDLEAVRACKAELLSLLAEPRGAVADTDRRDDRLRRQYLEWRDGPAGAIAMPLFRRFAREMLAAHRRFGIKLLIERVRWEVRVSLPTDADGFRINNNVAPYLARDLLREMPELVDFIETRRAGDEDGHRSDG